VVVLIEEVRPVAAPRKEEQQVYAPYPVPANAQHEFSQRHDMPNSLERSENKVEQEREGSKTRC
jgi:hypothetical protein